MRRLRQRLIRTAPPAAAVVAVALAGLLAGVRLAGPMEHRTPLGDVRVQVVPALHGQVDGFIPLADWGVRADAFDAPIRISVEPRGVDRPALLRAVDGDRRVIAAAEADLAAAARRSLVRALACGILAAVLLAVFASCGLAAGGRRERRLLLGLPAAAAALAAILGAATLWQVERSFRLEAFQHPTFYARGAEMQQLLGAAEKARRSGQRYGSQVDRTLSSFASLLADASEPHVDDGRRALVASDLHANTLALDPLRRLAGGQPLLIAGDFGHDGNAAEVRMLADRVAGLSRRVVAVSGNHDSRTLMRRLAARGVLVLTQRGRLRADGSTVGPVVVQVDGLRVAGYSDPLEWRGRDPHAPGRVFSFSERPGGAAEERAAQEDLIAWFTALRRPPDVLLVHQNGLAQALARRLAADGYDAPLTIVCGHDHRQHVDRHGAITVVDGGTAGAGGVLAAGSESIGVAELHFARRSPRLRAVDLVQVEPFSGAAQARREVLDEPSAPGGLARARASR